MADIRTRQHKLEVAQRIADVRLYHKLTQRNFSRRIGVHSTTCQRIEQATHYPSVNALLGITQTFGISLAWLLLGEGDMKLSGKAK